MKKRFGSLIGILLIVSLTAISWSPAKAIKKPLKAYQPFAGSTLEKYAEDVFETIGLQHSGLSLNVFKKAFTGFINLKACGKLSAQSSTLTIIDFTKPSREKRMWIINVVAKELKLHTLVAHGERSGPDVPNRFSDKVDSRESSLGFYLTDDIYFGDHGRALRLDGLDEGFNANARKRAIVIHGADYVCEKLIARKGRLGRSFGCLAVSPDVIGQVIDTIQGKTVLFINGNSKRYNSKYLDDEVAANYIAAEI